MLRKMNGEETVEREGIKNGATQKQASYRKPSAIATGILSEPDSCFEVGRLKQLVRFQKLLHTQREEIRVWLVGIR